MKRKEKKVLIRILTSMVLLAAAVLAPAEGIWRLLLFLVPYLVVGYDILWTAVRNIISGQIFDENFLMSLATIGAFVMNEYPEAVAVMLLYQIGELFQDIAVGKSRKSIAGLMDIRPDSACVLRDGEELEVFPDEVMVGETILVRPGERVPLDGILLEGETSVDTAALTGETFPRSLRKGDNIISGSVNLTSLIKVQTTSLYEESTVSRILELVEVSAAKKAKTEKFITRFARYYTPCVVIGAVLLAVLPPLFLGNWLHWLERGLIFLVVSCPCALVISVPLSFFGGIGGASKRGILIKGSNYLEALSKVHTVVFDKTGTLTHGNFEVSEIHPVGMTEEELLCLAAHGESFSGHPIAESIGRAYEGAVDKSRIGEITEHPGLGVETVLDGKTVFLGNTRLMEKAGVLPLVEKAAGTVVHAARDGVYCGCIIISDRMKSDAKEAVGTLIKEHGARVVMLTGDSMAVGRQVAADLHIPEVHAELLPGDKVAIVEKLLEEKPKNATLSFVGDGINDAPVLSRADIGIAMGALGSDAAIEAADVVIMDDQPSKVSLAVKIARRTMKIVWQNIIFALGIKGIVLILGALGFANMWIAVFADVGVAMLAVLNAMRALKTK